MSNEWGPPDQTDLSGSLKDWIIEGMWFWIYVLADALAGPRCYGFWHDCCCRAFWPAYYPRRLWTRHWLKGPLVP